MHWTHDKTEFKNESWFNWFIVLSLTSEKNCKNNFVVRNFFQAKSRKDQNIPR